MTDIQKLFNSWAVSTSKGYSKSQWMLSKWENLEGVQWPEQKIKMMIGNVLNALELSSKDIVLDLGCGGGWIMQRLQPHARQIIGLDFSLSMLQNGLELLPGKPFICGRAEALPFKNEACDAVLCYFVFINIMEDKIVEDAILEMIRVLKKGGRAFIGQMPDASMSQEYDKAKKDYLKYCAESFSVTKDCRDDYRIPQKLFNKAAIEQFLKEKNISYQIRPSFNPFYRDGHPETIDWRFDLLLVKE